MFKKIFGIVLLIVALGELWFFLGNGHIWPPLTNPTDGVIRIPIVKQSGGSSALAIECGDRSYIRNKADYIIEGTVKYVDTGWNEKKTSILTYTDLEIEQYVKGTSFDDGELVIVTPGGCVKDVCQTVEDQPIFYENKEVRIYFKETNGEFSIVCAQRGVEEIL